MVSAEEGGGSATDSVVGVLLGGWRPGSQVERDQWKGINVAIGKSHEIGVGEKRQADRRIAYNYGPNILDKCGSTGWRRGSSGGRGVVKAASWASCTRPSSPDGVAEES